ncbi:MAG: peptidoglycan D,D-transpeptidase FtsI family protein [Nitrospinota bacterium]
MKNLAVKYKKMRIAVTGGCIMFLFAVVVARLYYIQILQHELYASYSRGQYLQKVRYNPTRGKILDRNMTPLAITVPMQSVFASPYKVKDKPVTASILAEALEMDSASVLDKLEKGKNFVWIKRRVEPSQYRSLHAMKIPGISFLTEDRRSYPQKTLAARTIGFCGTDNQGLAGLEYLYDKILLGSPDILIAKKDALGRIYGFADGHAPRERYEMVITIDSNIQYIVEKLIRKAHEKYNTKAALAVVMAAATGEILALAEQPDFDPNSFSSYPLSRFKSLAVTQSYEPGSIFKVFLAASALDAGVASPDDEFDGQNGSLRVGGKTIHEANGRGFGMMTFSEIIWRSSNIGAIKVARELGEKRFYQYIKRLGFGRRSGIDLPGEASGLVRHYDDWSALSLPSMSFGQEINVTPIQLITALSVIGNGGLSVKPHFFKQLIRNNVVIRDYPPHKPRRIISSIAARQTIDMMRMAVEKGTGKPAMIKGYDIAGKTGTAQKFDKELERYSREKYLASFLALFPANDPVISVLVMLDEPDGPVSGGRMAGPIARDIIVASANYLGIPSSVDTTYEVNWDGLREKFLASRTEPEDEEQGNWLMKLFAQNSRFMEGIL